jgi:hypothetical protein
LHTITGACTPVCLLAASIPVEAVTPPSKQHARRLYCTAGLNRCQLTQPSNRGCTNFMATVFKDLLSILVDSKKKSTPRQARLAALFKFEPLVEASSPTHLMLQETPEALQFGSGGACVGGGCGAVFSGVMSSRLARARYRRRLRFRRWGETRPRTIYNWFVIALQPIRCCL